MEKENKKYGIGTLSPIIAIAAFVFSHLYLNKVSVGREMLDFLGTNYSEDIITMAGFILALFLGIKYNEHKFSKAGVVIVLFFLFGGIIFTILAGLCSLIYG